MATSGVEVERSGVQLKHLGFVKTLAINAVVLVLKLYDDVKHKSGPLESTVGKVEHVVTALGGPIYNKFKEVPTDVLVFLDNKVDKASHIFDKHAPPSAKNVVSIVKSASNFLKESKVESPAATISHAGQVFDEHAPPVAKDLVKRASDLVQNGPLAAINSRADKISKKGSSIFNEPDLPIPKGLLSKAKNASGKKTSNVSPQPITKGLGSIFKKTSDLVHEGPAAAISQAGKISKEASHIFDEGVSSIGTMIEKTSDLVKEGPAATISHAGKISNMFDEYAPPIAKNVVSKAQSVVKEASDLVELAKEKGPFAAISHAGIIFQEFAVKQLVMLLFKVKQYTFLFGILEKLIPIATDLLKKYNNLVKQLRGKGWNNLFSYVPLVPVEEIELAYKLAQTADVAAKKSGELAAAVAAAAKRSTSESANILGGLMNKH